LGLERAVDEAHGLSTGSFIICRLAITYIAENGENTTRKIHGSVRGQLDPSITLSALNYVFEAGELRRDV
jgi:hypothetical protein